MVFSSLVFLCIFLPLLLLVYFTAPKNWRNVILLAASLFFYWWGEPRLLSVMLLSILINYLAALLISSSEKKAARSLFLTLGILINLSLLFYFKYMDFFIHNLNALFGLSLSLLRITMPIGISFYTFQALSYLVDVYRRDTPPGKNVLNVGLYIALFPQLIAGPIVKYHELSAQIASRNETLEKFSSGMCRFLIGLAKKVLIANVMGEFVDELFQGNPAELNSADVWLCALAYSFQIFFDFSGYSDMAIGLGQMFGFGIPENFNYPYVSCTVTEFWRRWHISLSTWFKEYLYIPLGGSHCSKFRTCINLLIVFAATGFWHGADWTFIVWGLWHGFFILLERIFGLNKKTFGLPVRILQHVYLLLVVVIGWIFFRAENFQIASMLVKKMFCLQCGFARPASALSLQFIVVFCAAVFFSTQLPRLIYRKMEGSLVFSVLWKLFSLGLLYLTFLKLAASSYNPFIYFRF